MVQFHHNRRRMVLSSSFVGHPRPSPLLSSFQLSGYHQTWRWGSWGRSSTRRLYLISNCSSSQQSGDPTGHHGVLGRVGAIGDNQTCNPSTSIRIHSLRRGNSLSHRNRSGRSGVAYQQRRRADEASLLLPVSHRSRRVAGRAIDVQKGALNFLKGATPSQDMMTVVEEW